MTSNVLDVFECCYDCEICAVRFTTELFEWFCEMKGGQKRKRFNRTTTNTNVCLRVAVFNRIGVVSYLKEKHTALKE